jgi:hypothetical protein
MDLQKEQDELKKICHLENLYEEKPT